ncbi:MAG: hypothetical protein HY996_00025 [Micrococcales bacterium]|nr:hypothetical protein [Micrococcales bacterium]
MPEPGPPSVMPWYRLYCIVMALLYVAVAGCGFAVLSGLVRLSGLNDDPVSEDLGTIAGLCLAVGVPLAAAFVVAIFAPRRPWAWTFGAVLIGLGMTSACCLPACIPILVAWLKPDAKAWYGKDAAGSYGDLV